LIARVRLTRVCVDNSIYSILLTTEPTSGHLLHALSIAPEDCTRLRDIVFCDLAGFPCLVQATGGNRIIVLEFLLEFVTFAAFAVPVIQLNPRSPVLIANQVSIVVDPEWVRRLCAPSCSRGYAPLSEFHFQPQARASAPNTVPRKSKTHQVPDLNRSQATR
jgi:hypothetical protein